MKKKIISFMLSLVLLSTVVTPSTVAYATADDNGMEISKTATANADGSYTITLEAYATGEKFISEVTEDVPTDIILVLDQSGSMADAFDTVTSDSYSVRSNSNMENYPYRQNGGSDNIWYKVDEDSFVRVSMRVRQDAENIEWKSCITWHLGWGDCLWNSDMVEWSNSGVLYQLLDDGTYARCYVTGGIFSGGYTYTYADGTSEHVSVGANPTQVDKSRFFYASSGVTNIYDYFYVDADGNEVAIETSTGDNTKPTKTYYSLTTTSTDRTKLQALKDAVSQFSKSVEEKATATGVNHRIAVVGFASGNTWNGQNYNYNNTEVFVGANEYRYGSAAQGVYSTAFMDMNDSEDVANITASIGALDANGGTLTNLGVEMANGIFNANPVPAGEKRNRVVIVFTDGQPGWSGYDSTVATSAVNQAATAKNTYGATVYTVGIFEGANVNGTDNTNTFMRNLSSGDGYYLTASDSTALNNIFQQISSNIESGGSSTTLDANAVIRDIIAPQFELPANATKDNIKLFTADSDGSTEKWKNRVSFAGNVEIDKETGEVSVSGFSFKDNWCGSETINDKETFHDGKKLIIEFTVWPKAGFLGGNDVYTNTDAGIYENDSAEDPIKEFEKPTVNVPIGDVNVSAVDKNVYYSGEITANQLKNGTGISVGGVTLDPSKPNYGLEDWQTKYVDITVTVKDANNNVVSDKLENLTDNTTYTVEVTVAPKTTGTSTPEKGAAATAKDDKDEGKINVFKPEITWRDSAINMGETANYNGGGTTGVTQNFVRAEWKHNGTVAIPAQMIGTEPALTYAYSPEQKDSPTFTTDTYVKVTVKANDEVLPADVVTFVHQNACEFGTHDFDPANGQFIVHIKSFDLKIVKQGCMPIDENQSFIFEVTGPDGYQSTVTIQGNSSVTIKGLKVGEYTVTEQTGWSWRYTPTAGSRTFTPDSATYTVTFDNSRNKTLWLNGCSWAVNKWGGNATFSPSN